MKKINLGGVGGSRLALKKETVRRLGDRELGTISAGWECSVTGSGKVMCSPLAGEDAPADRGSIRGGLGALMSTVVRRQDNAAAPPNSHQPLSLRCSRNHAALN